MKQYKRFFAFGCSFTKYAWPTWANIIARDTGLPFQNWGYTGAGNVYIHHKMVEAKIKESINDDDLVIVNWSSWHREDRVNLNGDWMSGGNIFNNIFFDKKFIKKYWSIDNDIVKNATAIISGNCAMKVAYQSHMIDYDNIVENYERQRSEISETLHHQYPYFLNALPEKKIFYSGDNTFFNNVTTSYDPHPDILGHLGHVKQIYNDLGWELKQETIDYYNIMQERICKRLPSHLSDHRRLSKKIAKIYSPEDF